VLRARQHRIPSSLGCTIGVAERMYCQAGAVAEGTSGMTMEEIDQEIRAYRKSRKT
jgi:hypothetical protein